MAHANGSYEGHMSSERNRKVRGSFLFLDQTKENKFNGREKRREKKKSVRGKGRKKGKERKRKKRERRESVVHSSLFSVSTIKSR